MDITKQCNKLYRSCLMIPCLLLIASAVPATLLAETPLPNWTRYDVTGYTADQTKSELIFPKDKNYILKGIVASNSNINVYSSADGQSIVFSCQPSKFEKSYDYDCAVRIYYSDSINHFNVAYKHGDFSKSNLYEDTSNQLLFKWDSVNKNVDISVNPSVSVTSSTV